MAGHASTKASAAAAAAAAGMEIRLSTVTSPAIGSRDDMDDPSHASPLTGLISQADHDLTSHAALHDVVVDVRGALNRGSSGAGPPVTLWPAEMAVRLPAAASTP